jgi:hypothetical protein
LSLSDYQRAVLIGNILGDGHLEPNWSKTNYKLKINHQLKHKDYVMWEYDVFREWVLTEPKLDKWNNSFQFRTISHREITGLRDKFYKDGKKIDLIQWNKDIEEDIVRTRNVKEREIEKIEQRLKLEQERKDDKQKALELQITAIDSALADIKSISKESNEQAGGK